MKRHKNLYRRVWDFRRLLMAWQKARKGKRYSHSAATFERNLDEELLALRDSLRDETYQPSKYHHFVVHEPKRRKISAAPFKDRVVHHALCNVLIPIYEKQFIFDSYANRVGKGTHKALDRCTYFMRRYKYVLQCDIQQFFPAIDHAILKAILARKIGDPQVLRLCGKIIDSGVGVLDGEYTMRYFEGDDLFAANRPRGLPIGNLTSQFWANVYLNDLDHFVKRTLKCTGYVRYVDDFILFADDKKRLHQWRAAIITFLRRLRLTIHENRAQPRPTQCGISFLGFIVFPNYRLIKREKGIAYRKRLYGRWRSARRGELPIAKIQHSIQSWIGHAAHGDTWGLRRTLLGNLPQ